MRLRSLHRTSAFLIGAFALVHIANHLMSLKGVPAHLAFMGAARRFYRHPVLEMFLMLSAAVQLVSGMLLVVRGWKQRRGLVAWLQAGSGTYLAFFLFAHVGAVLFGRAVLGLDTNFYYAAAGLHVPPFQLFFVPYYLLAVLALFTHLGCAAYWQVPGASATVRGLVIGLPMGLGGCVSLLIVLALAGRFHPVQVPEPYKAIYVRHGHEPTP